MKNPFDKNIKLTTLSWDNHVDTVNRSERWEIYHRLQELQIPCQCSPNQPLRVQLDHATAAIQLWSVVRQLTAPRSELISWLNLCWEYGEES